MILKTKSFTLFLILYSPILVLISLSMSPIHLTEIASSILFYLQLLTFVLWSNHVSMKILEKIEFKDEIKIGRIRNFYKLTLIAFLFGLINTVYPLISENKFVLWIIIGFYGFFNILIYLSVLIHYFILAKFICMKENENRNAKPWVTFFYLYFFPFTIREIQSRIRKIFNVYNAGI